jgi:hypothetical protein
MAAATLYPQTKQDGSVRWITIEAVSSVKQRTLMVNQTKQEEFPRHHHAITPEKIVFQIENAIRSQ